MAGWLESGNVVLGWALGLGSALVVDWGRGKRRASSAKAAILYEFDELAFRLSAVVFKLELQSGRLNRETIEWAAGIAARYDGPNKIDSMPVGLAELLKASDADLAQVVDYYRSREKASFIPEERASYTSVAISQLHEFDAGFAVRVMDVLSRLRIYNELRESGLRYTLMTFDAGVSEDNHARILENAANADQQLARQARMLADKIAAITLEYGAKPAARA